MNISKFFIDRPIFAGVLSVLILLAGLLSVFKLPISEYPEVVPPLWWYVPNIRVPTPK
jgi:multidrug efflux pump